MANLFEDLFGFEIRRKRADEEEKKLDSFAPKIEDDGAVVVAAGGVYGTYLDLDGNIKNEADLVTKYREMALHAEIDAAVNEITNEAIVNEEGEPIVELILDELKVSDAIKEMVTDEFKEVLRLLEFETKAYDIFKRWYVDGRLYYHAIIDPKNLGSGIRELRYVDPRKIRKIREVVKKKDRDISGAEIQKTAAEYYIYNERGLTSNVQKGTAVNTKGLKIAKDSVVMVTSGLVDPKETMVLGYLHPSIKPLNMLRSLEDATIIYCVSRAPERRIFYIDVGNLPKAKAEQYLNDMRNRHKNKLVYDSQTGDLRDDRKFMTMLEDYWLPRREGSKGTEIITLPPGQQLGEMGHVEYFRRKLQKSLYVPMSRLDPEALYSLGRASQISQDEVNFARFIDRIQSKFAGLFLRALERQLILKAIIIPEDWDEIQYKIRFRFNQNNFFSELKDLEVLGERISRMTEIFPYIGRFYSNDWARKKILQQTEEEIAEQDAKIALERSNPQFSQPLQIPGGMDPMMGGGDPNMMGQDPMGPMQDPQGPPGEGEEEGPPPDETVQDPPPPGKKPPKK